MHIYFLKCKNSYPSDKNQLDDAINGEVGAIQGLELGQAITNIAINYKK